LDFQLDFSLMSFKEPPKVDRIFTLDDDFWRLASWGASSQRRRGHSLVNGYR
jgi:hypothetical protein